MKHYYDSVLQVRSGLTIPAPGVSITVNLQGTQTAAVIYSDDGITTKLNPLATDANGRFDFYIANGRYDLIFAGTGFANFTQFNVEITDAMDTTTLGKTPVAFTANNTHAGTETFSGPVAFAGGITGNFPGPVFNIKNYGAVGDAQHITDGVTGGGTKTITSASAPFKASDVGKKIVCGTNVFSTVAKILSVNTPTNTIATTDTTDGGAAGSLKCIWYTQDDTTAFQSANTAANASITSIDPNSGKTLGTPPGTIYCPPGGYAVSGRIYSSIGSGSSVAPSFKGDQGKNHCIIYVIPGLVDPNDGVGVLVASANNVGFDMEDIVVDGLGASPNASHAIVQCFGCTQFTMKRLKITNISTNSLSVGTLDFNGSSGGSTEDIFVQGAGTNNDFACSFNGSATSIVNRNMVCSNHNQNIIVDNGGGVPRNLSGANGITFIGGFNDECAGGNCFVVSNGGLVNLHDFSLMVGAGSNPYALTVDGTSRAYLSNVSCGVFGVTSGTTNCMNLASGAFVAATNSDLRGNDSNSTTGVAINGPAGATFVDLGGNKFLHSVSGTISPVTVAQYATLAFTGGIIPKSTQTHTLNTCYAVTGNLLATAQNLCTILLDQNYQVLNITAQSGGTTPTNSSCTGAPVITLSDGTRSATLTMTTGKTAWSSAVDAQTNVPGQVFASGATLTVSIGANTCATPPSNVSVNYNLQSVLNP